MELTIQSHNFKVNNTLETYARKKLDKLDRYLPNIAELRVDLSRQNTRRGDDLAIAQITVRHERGAILRAEERTTGEFEEAINGAVDKMYRQIQRFKGKRSRKGRERFSATIEELNLAEAIPDVEVFTEETVTIPEENLEEVVRRKAVALSAMNEIEAIEQMELLGHTFFVFYNAETGGINVIYKRSEGGYGVLIPEVQ
ncbi:MAG: ribosome-associated translation inhibitor RaiA [Anaerolineae bacterium]|nr:ribosome-associated translation inhibitor RaiA [Anaerolineae bacterium]MBN8618684.1 ribosome-associated translation inhibitor RaiA [Anaerolineae bacterium]